MNIDKIKTFFTKRFRLLSVIVPKKKRLWVFGCWNGKLYADNSKYLFEYISDNHPEIESVWISRFDNIVEDIRRRGYVSYNRLSVKGILCALRAEAAFITSDETSDISFFVNRNCTKIIQLYHGISGKGGKICLTQNDTRNTNNRFQKYYCMASSPKYIEVFSRDFGISTKSFYLTGYPRNDTFVTKPRNPSVEQLKAKYPGHRFIIYMPTHRGYGKKPIDITEFHFVNEELRRNNVIMIYKPHVNEMKNIKDKALNYSNIILASDPNIWGDVYSYMHYFDLLISDYSSIVYDFLCSGKPIVLHTYDIEYMRNDDFGINDFFEETPPGPFCYDWNETLEQVFRLLENDDWKERREECRKMFHPFRDGKNSQRVYETSLSILK